MWSTLKKETSLNGAQFRGENEKLSSNADVLPKISSVVISRCFKEKDENEKMHMQSVQSYCFCSQNMQICDVLVAIAVVRDGNKMLTFIRLPPNKGQAAGLTLAWLWIPVVCENWNILPSVNKTVCFNKVKCTSDEFKCGNTSECIPKSKICDHTRDCPYGEDEPLNCCKLS